METTKKHFEIFAKEVKRCLKKFGLSEWQVYVEHGICDNTDARAECYYDVGNRASIITLSETWNDIGKITVSEIKRVARHESIHLLVCRLAALAHDRYICERDVLEEQEAATRRIHRIIFGDDDLITICK